LEHFVLLIYPELCFIASFKNVAMLIIRSLSVFGEKLSVSNPSFFRSIGKSDTDHFYRCFELTDRLLTVFLWLITLPIINFFKRVWRECEHVIFSDAPIRRQEIPIADLQFSALKFMQPMHRNRTVWLTLAMPERED
jgi:hypothetical protein